MSNSTIDINSASFSQDPYRAYEELRKAGNVHFLEKNGSWIVIGFAEIVEILNNTSVFSSEGERLFDPILLNCDPPKHTYHRRILSSEEGVFSRDRIRVLEDKNRVICRELFNKVKDRNQVDILTDIALPYSSLVILGLLGISTSENAALLQWSGEAVSTRSVQNNEYAWQNWQQLLPIVSDWVDTAFANRSSRGLSEIIFHSQAEGYFSKEQIINLTRVLLLGGNETTPNLISSALLVLLNDPQLMEQVRADHSMIDLLLNETLRISAPTQIIARTTKTETVLNGQAIPARSLINLAIGAANRDPSVFTDPDKFDLHRNKSKILSFGHGAHYCLGVHLAKQEARIFFEELFHTFPGIKLLDPFVPQYRQSTHVRGLASLPVDILPA